MNKYRSLNKTTIMIGCLVGSFALVSSLASNQQRLIVKLHYGQNSNADSNQILPTTPITSFARRAPVVLIPWKSTDFRKYTPPQRCIIVPPQSQQSWTNKRLDYLVVEVSPRTEPGIICVASTKTKGDGSHMVFTLDSGADDSDLINEIRSIQWEKDRNPISQGSGNETVDIQK